MCVCVLHNLNILKSALSPFFLPSSSPPSPSPLPSGVLAQIDYLEMLGVDSVWLSPFYEFGGVDMGYDWTDHRAVDRRFGEDGDVDELFYQLIDRGSFRPSHTCFSL